MSIKYVITHFQLKAQKRFEQKIQIRDPAENGEL